MAIIVPVTPPIIRPVIDPIVRGAGLPWDYSASATPGIPWLLDGDGDDATWSGSNIATWPSLKGPNAALVGGMGTPQLGSTLNGHQGVRFRQAFFDQLSYGNLAPAGKKKISMFVLEGINDQPGTALRMYLHNTYQTIDNDHWAVAFVGNTGGGWENAFYNGNTAQSWTFPALTNYRGTSLRTPATKRAHVLTFVETDTGLEIWQDLVLMGTYTGAWTLRAVTDLVLSGSKAAALAVTCFDGTIYRHRFAALDNAPRTADVRYEITQMMVRYGLLEDTLAEDTIEIFGEGNIVALYDFADRFNLEYSAVLGLTHWRSRLATAHEATVGPAAGTFHASECGGRGSMRYSGGGKGYRADTLAPTFAGTPADELHWVHCAKNLTGAGLGSTDGVLAAAGSSTTSTEYHVSLLRGNGGTATPADPHTRSLRLSGAGTRSAIRADSDGSLQAVQAIINSQAENPDSCSTYREGKTLGDLTNLAACPGIDRVSFGFRVATGANTASAAAHAVGQHVLVRGPVSDAQRDAYRAAVQAIRGGQ